MLEKINRKKLEERLSESILKENQIIEILKKVDSLSERKAEGKDWRNINIPIRKYLLKEIAAITGETIYVSNLMGTLELATKTQRYMPLNQFLKVSKLDFYNMLNHSTCELIDWQKEVERYSLNDVNDYIDDLYSSYEED